MAIAARNQPQGLVRLNASNPVTVGLASLIVPGGAFDAIRRKPVTLSGGATVGASKHGNAWQGATGGTVDFGVTGGLQTLLDTTKSFEFYTRIYVSDASSRQMPMADFDSGGGNNCVSLEIQAGGAWYCNALNTGNLSSIASGGAATVGWHDINAVVTYTGANFQTSLYVDGVLIGTGPALAGPLRTSTGSLRLMSAGAYLSLGLTGQMPISAFWNRNLSQDERASIRRNPWQLFDAPSQSQFPMAAAATAILLAMLEAGAAVDGSSATVISAASAAEAGSASDATQSIKATSAAVTEAGAAVDVSAGTSVTATANTEALAATDSISTGAITSASVAEAGAVIETSSALSAGIAAITESGAAADSRSAVAALGAASTDTLTAADASSTSSAATGVSMAEAGSAAETTSSTQQSIATTSEAAAASDTAGATMATAAGRSDALTAADLQQTGGTIISASITESGAVADFVLASYMLAAQITEGASASDWLAASFMGVASISESSPAIDITSGRWVTSAAVTDALAALALTTAQLGGQLKPNPHRTYVGRARIRSITGATRIRSM